MKDIIFVLFFASAAQAADLLIVGDSHAACRLPHSQDDALDVARMMTFGTYDDNATSWMSGAVRQYWVKVGNSLTNMPAAVWQATRAEYGY